MKDLFDAIPDEVAPEVTLEDATTVDVIPPDGDEVIRPAAEEELTRIGDEGSLVEASTTSLGKHLLWTFGPHHGALPFMLQLRMELDGERIVTVDPEIGWLHQGLEKEIESTPSDRVLSVVERLHVRAPLAPVAAFTLAVERLAGVDAKIPDRVRFFRVVGLELARIVDHLNALLPLVRSHAARSIHGVFVDAERKARNLLEMTAFPDGASVFARFGGLSRPIAPGVVETLEKSLPDALAALRVNDVRLRQSPSFVDALKGLGAIKKADAVSLGLTGPAIRACGIPDDVRVRVPYFGYDRVQPKVAVGDEGDALARFFVRLDEVFASSALVIRALAQFRHADPTEAAVDVDEPLRALADGTLASGSVESASGEISALVVADGAGGFRRGRFKTSSFALVAALPQFLAGCRLDEVCAVIDGLGIVGTEVDR